MMSVTCTECGRFVPFTPLIVTVYVPGATAVVVVIVKVEEPFAAIDVGLNTAVAPVGNPLATERLMVPLKPSTTVLETVYVVFPPGAIDCEAGVAAIMKPGNSTGLNINVP